VKVVLDTNVLFSAFTAHGVCAGLYEECLFRVEMFTSEQIVSELSENLASKGQLTKDEIAETLHAVKQDAEVVAAQPLTKRVCRDADDDWILATAVAAKANVIVTGDEDLLSLGSYEGIHILKPREFLALLSKRQ
jgi:putative PIN family toxin of toxin-antitoxin system